MIWMLCILQICRFFSESVMPKNYIKVGKPNVTSEAVVSFWAGQGIFGSPHTLLWNSLSSFCFWIYCKFSVYKKLSLEVQKSLGFWFSFYFILVWFRILVWVIDQYQANVTVVETSQLICNANQLAGFYMR